jgi:hypothetical protein
MVTADEVAEPSVALDYETADAAIVYAIQKGWLIGEGEPHTAFASQMLGAACRSLRGAAGRNERD